MVLLFVSRVNRIYNQEFNSCITMGQFLMYDLDQLCLICGTLSTIAGGKIDRSRNQECKHVESKLHQKS